MGKAKIGLALGSGAARGWAHIGVIKVLRHAGIEPDVITGASIGALVGAAAATGSLERLDAWVRTLTMRAILALFDVARARGGLIRGEEVTRKLAKLGMKGRIEELPVPYLAVATDMTTGREIWLRQGDLGSAMHASFSMPGLFAPFKRDGMWLLDGGLVNPVPVSACRALGADIIIAVNLNGDLMERRKIASMGAREPDFMEGIIQRLPNSMAQGLRHWFPQMQARENAPGYFDVLGTSINIMQDQITRSRLAGEPPHVLINPHLPDFNTMDFDRAAEAIAEGENRTRAALPRIRDFLRRFGE